MVDGLNEGRNIARKLEFAGCHSLYTSHYRFLAVFLLCMCVLSFSLYLICVYVSVRRDDNCEPSTFNLQVLRKELYYAYMFQSVWMRVAIRSFKWAGCEEFGMTYICTFRKKREAKVPEVSKWIKLIYLYGFIDICHWILLVARVAESTTRNTVKV